MSLAVEFFGHEPIPLYKGVPVCHAIGACDLCVAASSVAANLRGQGFVHAFFTLEPVDDSSVHKTVIVFPLMKCVQDGIISGIPDISAAVERQDEVDVNFKEFLAALFDGGDLVGGVRIGGGSGGGRGGVWCGVGGGRSSCHLAGVPGVRRRAAVGAPVTGLAATSPRPPCALVACATRGAVSAAVGAV